MILKSEIMEIILIFSLWIIGWSIEYVLFRNKEKWTYSTHPFINSAWYFLMTIISYKFLADDLGIYKNQINHFGYLIFITTGVIGFLYYAIIATKISHAKAHKYINLFFAKFFELIFQQIIFLSLIITFNQNLPLFVISIFLIHLPLFFVLDKRYSFYFSISSIFGAVIFFLLITQIQNGIFLSLFAHLLFYMVSNFLILRKILPLPALDLN